MSVSKISKPWWTPTKAKQISDWLNQTSRLPLLKADSLSSSTLASQKMDPINSETITILRPSRPRGLLTPRKALKLSKISAKLNKSKKQQSKTTMTSRKTFDPATHFRLPFEECPSRLITRLNYIKQQRLKMLWALHKARRRLKTKKRVHLSRLRQIWSTYRTRREIPACLFQRSSLGYLLKSSCQDKSPWIMFSARRKSSASTVKTK